MNPEKKRRLSELSQSFGSGPGSDDGSAGGGGGSGAGSGPEDAHVRRRRAARRPLS